MGISWVRGALRLMGATSSLAIALGGAAATAQTVTTADLLFVVDESGSMSGEQAFLADFADDLEMSLLSSGLTDVNFGLVGYGNGFGGADNLGRQLDVDGMQFGSSGGFQTAAGNLVLSGGFEDGYSAIDFGLNTYNFTPGASVTIILVTDEDRDNGNAALDFSSIQNELVSRNITLVSIIDVNIEGTMMTTGVGTNGQDIFFVDMGMVATEPLDSVTSNEGNTLADYSDLALSTPAGCVADLNILRNGGADAEAFASVLADCIGTAAVSGPAGGGDLIHFLNVYRDSLAINMANHVGQTTFMMSLNPGDQQAANVLNASSQNVTIAENVGGLPGTRLWIAGNGQFGKYDERGGVNSEFDFTGGGVTVGVDMMLPKGMIPGFDTRVGGSISYQFLNADIEGPAFGSLGVDSGSANLFISMAEPVEGFNASAILSAGAAGYEQRRVVPGNIFPGDTTGYAVGLDLEGGYRLAPIPLDSLTTVQLAGFGGLALQHRHIDGFQEGNGGVLVDSFDDSSLVGKIGGRATLVHALPEGDLFVSGELSVAYDVLEDDQSVTINAGAIADEEIESLEDAVGTVKIAAGIDLPSNMRGAIMYTGNFSQNTMAHGIAASLEVRF